MRQFILFSSFIFTLLVACYAYFSPNLLSTTPLKAGLDSSGGSVMIENSSVKKSQHLTTSGNDEDIQLQRKIDELAQKQNQLLSTINDQQEELKNANVLQRLKALFFLQNNQSLLVSNSQQLTALNDQLMKNRQLLFEQRELVNINSQAVLQSQQQRNSMLKDQSTELFNRVRDQNNDALQRSRDLIEAVRQRSQDQQTR